MSEVIHSVSLSVAAEMRDVERVRVALENLSVARGFTPTVTARLQIVLDELVSNIIQHGYAGGSTDPTAIQVSMRLEENKFSMLLSDAAAPFDPSKPAQFDKATRPRIGGRGLEMVAALSDSVTHLRRDNRNLTTVTKSVTFNAKDTHKMATGLNIEEVRQDGSATVALSGRIDSGNAPHLTEHLTEIIRAGHKDIRLDLERLDYLTSAGFRTLLVVSDAAEEIGGGLSLANLSEDLRELFDLSGLTQAFKIA